MVHRTACAAAGGALLVALALALCAPASQAQTRTLSFRLEGGVPTGDFEEQVEDIGLGLAGQLLFQPQGVPLAFGFEGSFITYGRQVATVPVQFTAGGTSLAEQVTHNNIASFGLVLRLQPNGGAVQPYVEGIGGFNYLHTRVSLDETVVVNDGGVFNDSDPILLTRNPGNTVVDDFAFTYGGGGGVMIRVFDGLDDGSPVTAFLDFGARYLLGEEADYLTEGDEATAEGAVAATLRSTVDVIRPYFGLTFRF
ncbi:MAG: hypothetical protein AAF809_05915 [Bacteroidota bacterium]